ncbi:cAMP-independent regulatory protein pac2 [Vanrija pseudolonga]|uniref:cAMP-independent regulatory protein pac2 n=1 Tax=Vanrija pseudolonga TaxID=143232 RepID=A0AAF1BTJ3_9TREE|nr:cAMP-independent regulatory protein pac2 [Vanrija pseudolonga]
MVMYPSSSTQQPAAICALKSPADAIHILEAVRLGIVPRVTRRLTGHERSMIRPGTVWVWEEEETNMRRWTDGRRWGASRVGGGGFLVYTESSDSMSPPPSRGDSPSYGSQGGYYANGRDASTSTPPRRPEPLVKQTYSTSMTHPVTAKVKKFHVVAYSSKRNPQGDGSNSLPLPHQLPNLANIKITPGIWPDWETRRDDYGSRRAPSTPHSQAPHLPPHHPGHPHAHPHVHPHHLAATGPSTPVTATAGPIPPPPEPYPVPVDHRDMAHYPPPPPGDRRASPAEAGHPAHHDRRGYAPYYDPYDPRPPPHHYEAYPPPPDRYPHPPDRYYPYYPPPPPPPPTGDYRYDDRYYERGRERERVEREREDPAAAHRNPAGYYPPHPYYRDHQPPPPRDPREGSYPPRPTSSHSAAHLGKRSPDSRPSGGEMPEGKRMPSWSPAAHAAPRFPPAPPSDRGSLPPTSHGRHPSSGSVPPMDPRNGRDYRDHDPRDMRDPRDIRDPRDMRDVPHPQYDERELSRRHSPSPARAGMTAGGVGSGPLTLPPLRDAIDKNGERVSPRAAEREAAWGRVPV